MIIQVLDFHSLANVIYHSVNVEPSAIEINADIKNNQFTNNTLH